MNKLGRSAKSIIAVIIAVLYSIQAALSDDMITNTEWTAVAMAFVTAFGVWFVPNTDANGKNVNSNPS